MLKICKFLQVGQGSSSGGTKANDHYCWMRPEDIDYPRPVAICRDKCSDLMAETAAALAAASIVFKDDSAYSQKLVHGASTLWKFASKDIRHKNTYTGQWDATSYNSTSNFDELIWGGAWMYLATGNTSCLLVSTDPKLAQRAGAFRGGPQYGVLNWDNKLPGAQVSDKSIIYASLKRIQYHFHTLFMGLQ